MQESVSVTQRAYTLRLDGLGSEALAKLPEPERKVAESWRESLWLTHKAVNAGAKAFGDWLLTLRGGLSPALADEPVALKGGKSRPTTEQERRNRRVLLALGWLSVESKEGAPQAFCVDKAEILTHLRGILEKAGVEKMDLEAWSRDCDSSLKAAIRDDAVWVNRNSCFESSVKQLGPSLTPEEAAKVVFEMIEPASGYFHLETPQEQEGGTEAEDGAVSSPEGPKSSNAGRGWLSFNWGKGEKSDNAAIAETLQKLARADLTASVGCSGKEALAAVAKVLGVEAEGEGIADGVRLKVGWKTGRPSKGRMALEKLVASSQVTEAALKEFSAKLDKEAEEKGGEVRESKAWAQNLRLPIETAVGFAYGKDRDLIGEYAVMVDHALRRVSGGHSWIKNAEEERLKFEQDAAKMQAVPAVVKTWLDAFCEKRGLASGALDVYRIRRRALGGWKDLVAAWKKLDDQDRDGRVREARALQDSLEDEKFGDIQLFEALAELDALVVWKPDGKADPQPLLDYVAASEAQAKQQRFKVPAYRHPDALLHPVFCDFGNSRWNIGFKVHEALSKGKCLAEEELRRLDLALWDGRVLTPCPLVWRSKKLHNDLDLGGQHLQGKGVTRFDKLGQAAAGLREGEKAAVLSLFREKEWNGRLQAPRPQLEALAALLKKNGGAESEKTRLLRNRLRWFVSFSAKLQPQGPWHTYAQEKEVGLNKYGWPKVEGNKNRQGRAKLWLQRLPDLRVLSVDLGHRYAAACAVWQVCSQKDLENACLSAGKAAPGVEVLSFTLRHGKHATLYRRIGMDRVEVDEATGEVYVQAKPHPGPWARLDRQFLIKLQGEDKAARRATDEEINQVNELEQILGRARKEARKGDAGRVNTLQTEAVDLCRQGLRLHGDAARIAFNLTATVKLLPGGRTEALTPEGRVELLAETLALWHSRFGAGRWQDDWSKQAWGLHVAPHLNGVVLESGSEEVGGKAHKTRQEQWKKALLPLAHTWAGRDLTVLHATWTTRWTAEDVQWRKRLRWFRDWLLPSGTEVSSKLIRNVGGLSLGRIATLKALYQVQKAYAMRPEPQDLRKNVPKEGDGSLEHYALGVLMAMERLRENRVKQLASRLAAAALGLGKDLKPRKDDPRYAPCQAVVVENLERYRPEEIRTRRENRQLMDWSSAKVFKYLKEACELNGLHMRQVSPSYTSRQDSRTGAPGLRCQDVKASDFLNESKEPWSWASRVLKAREVKEQGPYEKFLVDTWQTWNAKPAQEQATALLRLPQRGGEIFVSSDRHSGAAKGLQADLNAAANIGLKALLDPDWAGAWWYVPCESQSDGAWRPVEKDVKGSLCPGLKDRKALWKDADGVGGSKGKVKKKEGEINRPMNLWRDPSGAVVEQGEWAFYLAYQKSVENRVLAVLRKHNGLG